MGRRDDEIRYRDAMLAAARKCTLQLDCFDHHLRRDRRDLKTSTLFEHILIVRSVTGAVE